MHVVIEFFQRPFVKRLAILLIIAVALYFMRSLITLFLLTFIFAYLINEAQKFIYRHIHKFIPVKRSFIVLFIYAAAIALIVLIVSIYAPKIVAECISIEKTIEVFVTGLLKQKDTGNTFLNSLLDQAKKIDVQKYAENGGKFLITFLGNLGNLSLNIFMALILSLFFMLQKNWIINFMSKFGTSKISWLYNEFKYFGLKFSNTFGKVLQTQILISFINAVLSVIMLLLLHFPYVLGLGVMIFLLGVIPVAGVFISLVPLSIIAYSVGGLRYIIYVLILIAILHSLESYILNPKLMSNKTQLPVFFTFLILIVSEKLLGLWGLLVGIPIFVFILDILDVKVDDFNSKRKKRKKALLEHNMLEPASTEKDNDHR